MKKIAIVGKARSGKTTVLDLMIKMYKKDGLKVAHYDVAHALYPITEKLYPGSVYGERKDREKLQLVGQTIREYDQDFWIKAMHNAILEDMGLNDYVDVLILTGFRQKNEFKYLEERGFTIIEVKAPEEIRKKRALNAGDVNIDKTFNDPTEKYLDKIVPDYTLYNIGSNKKQLEYEIRQIM